jgi:hypothetical protein
VISSVTTTQAEKIVTRLPAEANFFLKVKEAWLEDDHIHGFSADVKNKWSFTFVSVCIHSMQRDNFIFITTINHVKTGRQYMSDNGQCTMY